MAKIERKYGDYFKANSKALTTQIWDITITSKGDAKAPDDLKFRVPSVEGCPPAPEGEPIEYETGGFKFKFYGKIDKSGTIGFEASEDEDNKVGEFAKAILKHWAVGQSGSDKDTINLTASGSAGNNDLRFTVKVQLGTKDGTVKKSWTFYDAIAKVTPSGELGQEAGIFKYKFDFDYQVFEEDDISGTKW